MASRLELVAVLGAEHALSTGFVPFTATSRVKATPLRVGDRVWLELESPEAGAAYVIAQARDGAFEIWWNHVGAPPRRAFPKGFTAPSVPDFLWVVASDRPVSWLDGVHGAVDCSSGMGRIAPESPTDLCGYLSGLHRLAAPLPRSAEVAAARRPTSEVHTAQGSSLRGFSGSYAREGAVAVRFEVEPR